MNRLALLTAMVIVLAFAMPKSADAKYEEGDLTGNGHLNLDLPTGNFGNGVGMSFGAGVNGQYFLSPLLAVQGTISYIFWNYDADQVSGSAVEVLGGARYFLSVDKMSWYVGGDAGFYNMSTTSEVSGGGFFDDVESTSSSTEFGIAPFGGFTYEINEMLDLDVNLRYSLVFAGSTVSWLGLKAGVNYRFN